MLFLNTEITYFYEKYETLNMKEILITVSQSSDGKFWCHTEEDVYGGGLNSVGSTVKEAKADLMDCFEEAKADYEESGNVAEPIEFRYQYDLQSFFDYFSFLNVSEIAKLAGINPSLMRQYSRGIKKAGEKTYNRISKCLDNITKDLQAASFR